MKIFTYPNKPVLVKEIKHSASSKNDDRAISWFNTKDEDYFALKYKKC